MHTKEILNDHQKLFCDEYLLDFNAAAAARRSGYGTSSGYRLLQMPACTSYIQKKIQERKEKIQVTEQDIIGELSSIAFAKATDYLQITEQDTGKQVLQAIPAEQLSAGQRAAVEYVRQTSAGISVKLHDKVRALELLGKHIGLFAVKPSVKPSEDLEVHVEYGSNESQDTDEKDHTAI
ncbi:MAG TPA: terminase small subunit [Firmicutes bacterium]|nr:terminase small subunit [Bacillota bacterium]